MKRSIFADDGEDKTSPFPPVDNGGIDAWSVFGKADKKNQNFQTIQDVISFFPGAEEIIQNCGVIPTPLNDIRENLKNILIKQYPDISFDAPGSPFESLIGVSAVALALIQQSLIDGFYSVNPFAANPHFLESFARIYGVIRGDQQKGNAVLLIKGDSGLMIPKGTRFGDVNNNTYTSLSAGTIGKDGTVSITVFQEQFSKLPIPPESITKVISSFPLHPITCTNPLAGAAGVDPQSDASYRRSILDAGMVTSKSTPNYIKASLSGVQGVVPRTISIGVFDNAYVVTCSGGDPQQVAGAIYESLFDFFFLQIIENPVFSFSNSGENVLVTFQYFTGLNSGDKVVLSGAPSPLEDGKEYTVIGTDGLFGLIIDAPSLPSRFNYTGGCYLDKNERTMETTIYDGTDKYDIRYISPAPILVEATIKYKLSGSNVVNNDSVSQEATPGILAYINALTPSESINTLRIKNIFLEGIYALVNANSVTEVDVDILYNGKSIVGDDGIVSYDLFSYPTCSTVTISPIV